MLYVLFGKLLADIGRNNADHFLGSDSLQGLVV